MKKVLGLVTTASTYLYAFASVHAQDIVIDPFEAQKDGDGLSSKTPPQTILSNAISMVYTVAVLLVLVYLIWGAFKWITSGGDKEAIKSARSTITNALIGLGILALSFVILRVVGYLLGINVGQMIIVPLDKPSLR